MIKGETEPIHNWFELTYARYLTIPRSVLQSMPAEWQERFVTCLEELDETIDWRPKQRQQYRVSLHELKDVYDKVLERTVEKFGRKVYDPLEDYQRGRRRVEHRST